jgi:hypothetical protein
MSGPQWAETPAIPTPEGPDAGPYRASPSGIVWVKPTSAGEVEVPLTNFDARVDRELVLDDGTEPQLLFELVVQRGGRRESLRLTAAEFAGMEWPLKRLGTGAVVNAGLGNRDRAREAIQRLSGAVPRETHYAHTGWREVGDEWVYLHAGGAIGAAGAVASVAVELPRELARFALPAPPTGRALVDAVHASLRFLELAPREVVYPLYAAIWRAPLGPADFTLWLTGPTGAGKTELAALVQQHFGAEMDARHLPAAFTSTANALELLASLVHDAVLVVDDFAPEGAVADVAAAHRTAAYGIRSQGNLAGRTRLTREAALRPARVPCALRVCTGEDRPRGQSILARLLVLELDSGAVRWDELRACQHAARDERLAQALAGYVHYLAPRYGELRRSYKQRHEELREELQGTEGHRRTADIQAHLLLGFRAFLGYALEAGAITEGEHKQLGADMRAALAAAARAQAAHVAAAEPTERYFRALTEAIASGSAHVAGPAGDVPAEPSAWGWREVTSGPPGLERREWRPQGRRIGYVEGEQLYLLPDPAYAVAEGLLRDTGESLGVSERGLRRRLAQRRLLASTADDRETYAVRKTLGGARLTVLHLLARQLGSLHCGKPDQPDHADADAG